VISERGENSQPALNKNVKPSIEVAADRPYYKTIFHPSSGREPLIEYLDEPTSPNPIRPPQALSENPVSPFKSVADFEFASFVTKHRLHNDGIKDLLHLVHGQFLFKGPTMISFKSLGDVKEALDDAAGEFQQVRFPLLVK
jgi:hypothetical protein